LKAYQPPSDPEGFLRQVARFSSTSAGPREIVSYLGRAGIRLVVEAHMPRTRLDGAALLDRNRQPVVALTLRYDRVDSFWFTLLHELVHVLKHLGGEKAVIADDLDLDRAQSVIEVEADTLARNALIPRQVWRRSDAYRLRTKEAIERLASELHIHPAIVAGRLRYESGSYQSFGEMLGHGEIRRLFLETESNT
jgi:HTH-type transcriptional regulator/antitoxin HigA